MNYCTGWFEGWWGHCCQAHDEGYDAQMGQVQPDIEILYCVATSLPDIEWAQAFGWVSVAVAVLMHLGVRFFGSGFYRRAGEKKDSGA